MKKTVLVTLAILLAATAFKFQDTNSDPHTYFSKYLEKKSFEILAYNSIATLEECKMVFTDSAAQVYYASVADMKSKMTNPSEINQNETFVDVGFESFTTEDIVKGNGNYPGGMNRVVSYLRPAITFYKVELLRTKGADSGMAYSCWVYIQNKWVFFPKPWRAFAQ